MFNPVLHNPIRTNIVALLAKSDEVSFKEIKEALSLTDGNLNSHLKALDKAEYIETKKFFEGKKPKTVYLLNRKGKEAFLEYLNTLQSFLSENEN